MKNVCIFICGTTAKKCLAKGCFRTFNERTDSFEAYKDEDFKMVGFNTCPGCDDDPVGNLKFKMEKMAAAEVDTVHLSTCMRGHCEHYEEFAKMLSDKDFEVVGYTHGSKEGKKNNSINYLKGKNYKRVVEK